jgi:hypothetical protein
MGKRKRNVKAFHRERKDGDQEPEFRSQNPVASRVWVWECGVVSVSVGFEFVSDASAF